MHGMMNIKLIICSSNQATYRLLEKSYFYNHGRRAGGGGGCAPPPPPGFSYLVQI